MIVEFLFGFGLGFAPVFAMDFIFQILSIVAPAILRFIQLIVALFLPSTIRIVASSSGRTDFVESGHSRRPPKKPPDEFKLSRLYSISIPNRSRSLFDC